MSEYSSERADMLETFVKYRIVSNRWSSVPAKNLIYFDRHCSREFPGMQGISQHMVDGWCKQRSTESKRSRVNRCYPVIQLVKYLIERGDHSLQVPEMPSYSKGNHMSDHEAVQAMKDSNKQRDQTLPSELAALLDLEVEDIKHQGGRLKNVAEGDIGKRSVEIVGEAHDMNYKKVMRYLRLNSLVPELLDKVDDKKMGFMPAVELSYIKPKNQRLIAVSIDGEQASPSVAQAKKLRELDQEGKLNGDVIDGILSEKKKEDRGVIISTAELEKYFGKEVTPAKMKEQIIGLLDEWKQKQPPELAKAPKKMEKDK